MSAEIARAGQRIGRDPFEPIPELGVCSYDVRGLAHLAALGGKTEAEILQRAIHAALAELELVADRLVNTPEETVLHSIADRLGHVAEFAGVAAKVLEAERAEAATPRKAVTR